MTFKATSTNLLPLGCLNAHMLTEDSANQPTPDLINTSIALGFQISGACLPTMTQSLFHQGILHMLWPTTHRNTNLIITCIKAGVQSCTNFTPTSPRLWRSLCSKTVSCQIHAFLWKNFHQALHCRQYWLHILNYEHCANCHICDDFESVDHILLECDASGQNIIWPPTCELWLKKKLPWPTLSLGSILGCTICDFHDSAGCPLPSANHLYTIIISESIYLIWKI